MMSAPLALLILVASIAVTQCRVTFTYSEVLQNTDLDATTKSAPFKCKNGCYIYSSAQDADMWINDGTQDVQNFYVMGKPDKGTKVELAKWNDYKLVYKGDGMPSRFVFYVVDKTAPFVDTPVHAGASEFSFGFTGGSDSPRRFTLLNSNDPVPLLVFSGQFAEGYPRIYATGYDATAEDTCRPVYHARSQESAINSQLTITSPILTIDKGPEKAKANAVQVKTSGSYDKKPAVSSVVYKSPGYVGCSYIKNQIYSSTADQVQQSFSADVKTLDFEASLWIPPLNEAVKVTVNDEKMDLYGTTPITKHFDADKFDVSVYWNRNLATTNNFAIQFDLGISGGNQEVKSTTKTSTPTKSTPKVTEKATSTKVTDASTTVQTTTKSARGTLLLSSLLTVFVAMIY